MALRYDFDMVSVTPTGLPDTFDDLAITGLDAEKVAMFRDPKTVAALQQADEAVRAFLTDSGFALQHFDSGAPPGRFVIGDEGARATVIERLSANLGSYNLSGASWGGFEFEAFMDALSSAEPIEEELLAPTAQSPGFDRELMIARIAARKKKGRRMMALGGLMLGLVLLFYVATQTLA